MNRLFSGRSRPSRRVTAQDRAHLTLLGAVLSEDCQAAETLLLDPDWDLEGFESFLHRHRLAGLVTWYLQRLGCLGTAFEPLLANTRQAYLYQWIANERLARELARLTRLFQRDRLEVLSLKGPLLAQRFYGSLDARAISDLDLLVRDRQDLDRMERLLLADGYEPAYGLLLGRGTSMRFTHHFAYRKERTSIEVHWVLQQHYSFRIDYERLWRESEIARIGAVAIRVPSAEYELLLQTLSLLTDLQVGKLTLKPLVDTYRIVRHLSDEFAWDRLLLARRRERVLTSTSHFLACALEAFDCYDEFPRLNQALEAVRVNRTAVRNGLPALLHSEATNTGQKLAALRLYDASLVGAIGWWAISLPFRLAVYRDPTPGENTAESDRQ